MAYNADLYKNFTEAMSGNKGLAIISVLIDVSEVDPFTSFTSQLITHI